MRPKYIEVDKSLDRGCAGQPARCSALAALCELLRDLGSGGIAEGAETEPEYATLRRPGVGYVQGSLVGCPQEMPTSFQSERRPRTQS